MSDVVISLDDELMDPIDRAAGACGLSRNAYLARLIAQQFSGTLKHRLDESVLDRGLRELDELFSELSPHEDATMAVRAERDSR